MNIIRTSLLLGDETERDMESKTQSERPLGVFDTIIVGGGFAGLAAATQLGRARCKVLVIDDRQPRNRFSRHSHGFLGQDGVNPLEILRTAREQLAQYPTVTFSDGRAEHVARNGAFQVGTFKSRRLILAYGVRDILPDVEGLAELWGKGVFHCPYCHGYEVRDRPLAVLGNDPTALHQAKMIADWSDDVMLFTNGPSSIGEEGRSQLGRRGIVIEEERILRLIADGEDLAAVELVDGRRIARGGMLTSTRVVPVADLHCALGCEMTEGPLGPYVRTDERKETSVPGVFAAGDLARPMFSVSFAVADGAMAGAMTHQSLLAEDWA